MYIIAIQRVSHALEFIDVLDLDVHRLFASELLHHEHKAFFCHAYDWRFNRCAAAWVFTGGYRLGEISQTPFVVDKFARLVHALTNNFQNIVVWLVECRRNVECGGGEFAVSKCDE